jgi:hypothetical protein
MDANEYAAWKVETARSETRFILDEIHWYNRKEILLFKGGVDGVYVWIFNDGTATIGTYEGAVPHIGEAMFTEIHRNKVADNAVDALRIIIAKMKQPKLAETTRNYPQLNA